MLIRLMSVPLSETLSGTFLMMQQRYFGEQFWCGNAGLTQIVALYQSVSLPNLVSCTARAFGLPDAVVSDWSTNAWVLSTRTGLRGP
jgi:hypothetical protein